MIEIRNTFTMFIEISMAYLLLCMIFQAWAVLGNDCTEDEND